MEILTKDTRMHSLIVLYDMHTDYFKRAIDGISNADSHNRLETKANHVAWIAGSLVQERFELAKLFGIQMQQKAHALFDNHQGIIDHATYPALDEFQSDWEKISPILRELLANATSEKLDSLFEMEGMKMTHYELVSFMTYREAACIGQIALWRRLLNYPALKYDD